MKEGPRRHALGRACGARKSPWLNGFCVSTPAGMQKGHLVNRATQPPSKAHRSEMRHDPVTGRWVIYALSRRKRPVDIARSHRRSRSVPAFDAHCPFCPGNEDFLPEVIVEFGGKDSPRALKVVRNKYPALTPDGSLERSRQGIYLRMEGCGYHEVVIETPVHNRQIPFMSGEEMEMVIEAYHRRYLDLMEDGRIMLIGIFRNYGPRAGASLIHPHSQIIATSLVPGHIREQEYRAERAIAALRMMTVPLVRVVRAEQLGQVAASDLVPGDIVHLDAGSVVPADLRLLETASLRIQEAALTGESEAVEKTSDPLEQVEAPLGDRLNIAYSGTQVSYGRGVGVVVATGMATELGKIADLLQGVQKERTPLQQRRASGGTQLAVVGLVTAAVVAGLGALAGEGWSDLLLTAISVAVAVIQEGFPAVVTFTLAVGAQRMLRREALIRKLPAARALLPEGDFRNWDDIEAWAGDIARALGTP